MEITDMLPYLVAMGLGMLLGLERERRQTEEIFAGIRTLPLIALLGAIVQDHFPDFHVAAFLLVGLLISISYYGKLTRKGDIGITSSVASVLTYVFGALCVLSPEGMKWAVVFGTITLMLLTVKEPLHKFASKVNTEEMWATLKFAIITLVILPLLPNKSLDILVGLNPRFVWMMVVLVSGIGFGAYLLSRQFGARMGIGLSGFLGGFISSTATSVSMAQQSRSQETLSTICSIAVVVASVTMFPRVLIEISVVNHELIGPLLYPITAMFVVGLVPVGILFFFFTYNEEEAEEPELQNPFQLKPALLFGAFFALILLLTDYASENYGGRGTYISAFISGLMDVDAITLSLSKMEGEGKISTTIARNGIIIGAITNTAVKAAISWMFGTRKLGLLVTLSLFLSVLTGGAWLLFF